MNNFDLTKNFVSIRRDINKVSELNSILEAIENIVVMNSGDLVGNTNLGSPTRQMLFRRNTYFMLFNFVKQIEFSIRKYEPRISSVNVTANYGKADDVLDLVINAFVDDQSLTYRRRV